MGTVVKKSVSVPDVIWSAAERAADVRHTTVSALVTEALENYLKIQAGLQAVKEWEAENGPFTPEELAEADAILDAHGVGIRR
jgi:predicted transcriptional regulator